MAVDVDIALNTTRFDDFNDLYTAVYAILDDAKTDHELVKLYKGSHLSPEPHGSVLRFGEFFAQQRRGLLGFACAQVNSSGRNGLADLDTFDALHRPRLSMRAVFGNVDPLLRKQNETRQDLLNYLTGRQHQLGLYRGGSSGMDEESRAVVAEHFRRQGVPSAPEHVLVFCGGAKGIFIAFCAALMCRRRFDELHHLGGQLLAPNGYYQSLRLIPALFGGDIHVVGELTGPVVRDWLSGTATRINRALYVPLVNNATGQVLTADVAEAIAAEVLSHNMINPTNPVFVLGDDVYAGSYQDPNLTPMAIGAATGMSDWTVSVVSPSKTFALPTSRVAFATTGNAWMRTALSHFRTVFSHGRVPQATELAAAAALALTPAHWIEEWNHRYRDRVRIFDTRLRAINAEIGFNAVHIRQPQGGWYLPLRISRSVFPVPITSNVDAFTILLHYSGDRIDTGLGMLPGELFGHRLQPTDPDAALRATVAVDDRELHRFTKRLRDALLTLGGPDGAVVAERALRRARRVADIDTILANTRY